YADQPPATYVEQRIYDGFPSNEDEATLATFHRQEWPHRIGLIPSIEDERYRELGERTIATEQPQLLTAGQRTRWVAWRGDRLLATGDVPWLTVADAVAELKELSDVAPANQRQALGEIKNFLSDLTANRAIE